MYIHAVLFVHLLFIVTLFTIECKDLFTFSHIVVLPNFLFSNGYSAVINHS